VKNLLKTTGNINKKTNPDMISHDLQSGMIEDKINHLIHPRIKRCSLRELRSLKRKRQIDSKYVETARKKR